MFCPFSVVRRGRRSSSRLVGVKFYPTNPDDDALLWKKAVIVRAVYSVQDTVLDCSKQEQRIEIKTIIGYVYR